MIDVLAATFLVATACVVALAFGMRRTGHVTFARVERDGGLIFVDKKVMNAAYWVLDPLADACTQVRISANAITFASLIFAAVAGVLVAFGHFGTSAIAIVLASLGDALDGLVARKSKTASERGEVFDAAVDCYSEFFFLAGLAVHYRMHGVVLATTLAALLGLIMVSYASAKAEALGVEIPRGAMRRPERAVVLGLGATLVPLATWAFGPDQANAVDLAAESPMLVALLVVALVGNVSAVRRLFAIDRALASRATPIPGSASASASAESKKSSYPTRARVFERLVHARASSNESSVNGPSTNRGGAP